MSKARPTREEIEEALRQREIRLSDWDASTVQDLVVERAPVPNLGPATPPLPAPEPSKK